MSLTARTGPSRPSVRVGAAGAAMDAASLKRRAIRLLARREYSRAVLRQKLLDSSRDEAHAAMVESVLDLLAAESWLSDRRFAESFVRARAERHGGARLQRELIGKGIDRELARDLLAPLQEAELDRAYRLWQRRFGHVPVDAADRGRHGRFLIQRGFAPSTVRRVFERARSEALEGEAPPG